VSAFWLSEPSSFNSWLLDTEFRLVRAVLPILAKMFLLVNFPSTVTIPINVFIVLSSIAINHSTMEKILLTLRVLVRTKTTLLIKIAALHASFRIFVAQTFSRNLLPPTLIVIALADVVSLLAMLLAEGQHMPLTLLPIVITNTLSCLSSLSKMAWLNICQS
jgi:hypothetical protein